MVNKSKKLCEARNKIQGNHTLVIKPSMPVEIAGEKTQISAVSDTPVTMAELNPALAELGGFNDSDVYYTATAEVPSAGDGLNFAEITKERVKPISFVTH